MDIRVKNKFLVKQWAFALSIFLSVFFVSCSSKLGYAVILWAEDATELQIPNNTIAPVVAESVIHDTYTVSYEKQDITIKRGHVAFFLQKRQAEEFQAKTADSANLYGICLSSRGLVVREDASTQARQIYKLRPREVVRILRPASSMQNLGGLEGKWYEILTEDGTRGFAFDYYLEIDSRDGGNKVVKEANQGEETLEAKPQNLEPAVLNGYWYSDAFINQLTTREQIDLRKLEGNPYSFYADSARKLLIYKGGELSWQRNYDKFSSEAGDTLVFPGALSEVRVLNNNQINLLFRVSESSTRSVSVRLNRLSSGELSNYRKIALSQRRRSLEKLLSYGNQWDSVSRYGSIRLSSDGQFTWSSTEALERDGLIKAGESGQGILYFPYSLGPKIADRYQFLLNFEFVNGSRLLFLMKIEEDGSHASLRLASESSIDKGVLDTDIFLEELDIFVEFSGTVLSPEDIQIAGF